jgi:hypothetical protein
MRGGDGRGGADQREEAHGKYGMGPVLMIERRGGTVGARLPTGGDGGKRPLRGQIATFL